MQPMTKSISIICATLQSDTLLLKANVTVLLGCKSCNVPRHALVASMQYCPVYISLLCHT